jgi:hypothetical protein
MTSKTLTASTPTFTADDIAAAMRLADLAFDASLSMLGQTGEAAETARDLRIATQEVLRLIRKQEGCSHGTMIAHLVTARIA